VTNVDVLRDKQRLDRLFERGAGMSSDPELQAQWSRYLCVLASGFIESSVRRIYGDYARKRANRMIARFVDTRLGALQNPNMENILQWAGAFSDEWRERLAQATDGELKESIDSIVAIRHNIAHGRGAGVGYATMATYYRNALRVLDEVERLCERQSV
jgi:hypothetical protein